MLTLGSRSEMNVQNAPHFSVEIHFASLDSVPEEGALLRIQNRSDQTKAIRLNQSSNIDAIPDLEFRHTFSLES